MTRTSFATRRLAPWLSVAGVGLAASLLLPIDAAWAWAPIASSRPVWSGAAPYRLHSAGSVDLGGFSATEAEVRRGMDDWTRVSCTSLTTSYGGSTSTMPRTGDRESAIGWVESGWRYDSNAIGVTQPQFSSSRIGEADMEMNGVNFTWTTDSGRGSRVNTYSIVLHEGGHFFGLDHSSDSGAAMYFAYSGGIARLGTDDQNGICALYPSAGSDCTSTGCPSGYTCSAGACVRASGDGGVCSPCDSGSDCSGGLCLGYPDGNGYCGKNCTSNADCGGDICVSISGAQNQCIRARGSTPDCSAASSGCRSDSDCSSSQRCDVGTGACVARATGSPIGSSCGAGSDCASGVCFNGACSETCNWLDTGSCPAGFYCNGQATGACGSGVCLAGTAGAGAFGAPCAAATDCASLFCAEGVCATPCIPGGATSCPDGTTCQTGLGASCGSCQRASALGDPCEANEDCASRICAIQTDQSFCTAFCDAGSPCAPGFTCTPVDGSTSVCVPDRGGLGAPCAANEGCLSDICATFGDEPRCTRVCDGANPCPREYDCALTADGVTSVCQRGADPEPIRSDGGCGRCAAGGGSSSGAPSDLSWAAIAGLLGLLVSRRRRSTRVG